MYKMSLDIQSAQKAKKLSEGLCQKDSENQLEEAPTGQKWDSLSVRNNGKGLKHIRYV